MEKTNIYEKLSTMREAIKRAKPTTLKALLEAADKRAKSHKLILLYHSYAGTAKLKIVNMDNITESVDFEVDTNNLGVKNAKRCLYQMAFNIDITNEKLTLDEYLNLIERMKEKGVKEKEVLERYKLESLPEMTKEIYDKCMTVFDKMNGGKG